MNQNPISVESPQLAREKDKKKAPKRVQLKDLMGDENEVLIEHAGQSYRLRITRQNKLILTK